jgi:hypothetical protein
MRKPSYEFEYSYSDRQEHQAQRIDLERQPLELQLADAELRREKDLCQAQSATRPLQQFAKMPLSTNLSQFEPI